MVRLAVLTALAGCWTGSAPPPAPPPAPSPPPRPVPHLEVSYAQTMCLGRCPAFELVIRRGGRVEWNGRRFVAVQGRRTRHISRRDLEALDRAIERARFFERDEYGHFPIKPTCTTSGGTTTCTVHSINICTDTSHTIITVERGGRRWRIDDAHCSNEDDDLLALEKMIVDRAGVADLIGGDIDY